jgi:hypothetical protein
MNIDLDFMFWLAVALFIFALLALLFKTYMSNYHLKNGNPKKPVTVDEKGNVFQDLFTSKLIPTNPSSMEGG